MNVGQIKAAVFRFGFNSSDPVVDWINEAQIQFWDQYDWPWIYTNLGTACSAGSNSIAQPSDMVVPTAMQIADPGLLTGPFTYLPKDSRLTYIEDGWDSTTAALGRPTSWNYGEGSIYFDKAADLSYRVVLYYIKNPTILTSDANVPDLPVRYHYALIRGAAAIGLDAENQEERANVQLQRYQDIIDRAKARYLPQGTRFSTIRNVRD